MRNDLVSLIGSARSQLGASTYVLTTFIVILAGIVVSFLGAASQNQRLNTQADEFVESRSSRIEDDIAQRMQSYEQLLAAGATLFRIDNSITRDQWQSFIEGLQVESRYPGTLGVGFAEHVERGQLNDHVFRTRIEGFNDYDVEPSGNRERYVPVTYLEPFDERNRRALGYDMFSEPVRREALVRARDTGTASMTNTVTLVQESDSAEAQPGLLIYTPVYGDGQIPQNRQQRRERLVGYTYTALRAGDMLGMLLARHVEDERYAFSITDEDPEDGGSLYMSPRFAEFSQNADNPRTTVLISHENQVWQVAVVLDETEFRQDTISPPLLFILGTLSSILIGAFLFVLMLNRLGRIAVEHEVELQQTKDELLALASHQLRTPASGVKQYIGMVLQGYSGKISREQRQMLKRAYEANDRQLEIINQLLYVAKADAGQLRIEREILDFTRLVHEVISEYGDWAKQQNLTIKPKRFKQVFINADERYMRMIVENVLSNSIKYSYEGGAISIKIATEWRQLTFSVSDEGVGIRKQDMPKLFKKFSRIDNELSRRVGGSGIGLYLAQQLAKAHEGQITAEPHNGQGTTFTLTIPGVVVRRNRNRRRKKSE